MKIFKKITHKGFKAVLRKEPNNNKVYVTWFAPGGFEIKDWADYSYVLDSLLYKVSVFCDREVLIMWSF